MKKYTSYIVILIAGLLLGWFLFGGTTENETSHDHKEELTKNQNWTCSMHPQIMQPEAGDCPICGMDLIPAEVSAEGLKANQFKLTENAMALANIQTMNVGGGVSDASNIINLSGEIVVNADETATQPAHFDGRIDKLYITSIGQQVKMGDLIAEIYSPELVVAQQELIATYKTKNESPELYLSVRKKFKFWKIKDKQLSEIEKSGKVKMTFAIYSHVTGTVTDISVNKGAHIMDGHPIFKVSNLNTVWAEFDVYEKQLSFVKKGLPIDITTNQNRNTKIQAKVSFVDPILNTNTRTVVVRAALNNSKGDLKPGMFVNGELITINTTSSSISVPKTAVLWTGKRSLVYVKIPNESVFEMRSIELGKSTGKFYEVVSGLEIGEQIVVNGTFTVDAAAQLLGKKSMMTKVDDVSKKKVAIDRLQVDVKFQNQLEKVVASYLELKEEFVLSNADKTDEIISSLNASLGKVDMKLLKGPTAHNVWMRLLKEIKTSAHLMSSSKEIIAQRSAFIQLSSAMIHSVKAFGINKKIYNQFCPMADKDKGAYWLSFQKEIKNPYFGRSMLTCGNIEEIIE
jgi:Cu(I)/Ag(I) efflux system membrane fusion protein